MDCKQCKTKRQHLDQLKKLPVGTRVYAIDRIPNIPDFTAPIPIGMTGCVTSHCDDGRAFVRGGCGVGERVRFFTDVGTTLPKAIQQVQGDLDRPQVVELMLQACQSNGNGYYARRLVESLLAVIAPKSKSLRATRRLLAKQREQRIAAMAAARTP